MKTDSKLTETDKNGISMQGQHKFAYKTELYMQLKQLSQSIQTFKQHSRAVKFLPQETTNNV